MPARRNRCSLLLCAAALAAAAPTARAQQRPEANLLLQLFGGITTGSDLWEVNRQPMIVRGTEAFPKYDTLRITRRLQPGLVLGASATIFWRPSFGLVAEMVFLSMPTADDCTMIFQNTGSDLLERNQQLCNNLNSGGGAATAVAATVGGIVRLAPRGAFSPYLRAQVGLSIRNSSTTEVTSQYIDFNGAVSNPFVMVFDDGRSRTAGTAAFGAGFMTPITPGYQLRLEIRDQMVYLDRLIGPADNVAVAPNERFLDHAVTLLVGLDVVLEQKRGRRY
jgi:hypothetical protein